jgi:2-isopropylmalate synthase
VEFSAEDATRSDRDFLCRVIEAVIAAGCTTVNLPDTVGYATPDELRDFFAEIIARVPNAGRAVFSTHCHNDRGLAVANSLAAIQGGVRQVECSVNGIGERAGNASLEEFVMALRVRQDRLPYDTGIHSPAMFEASQLLSTLTSEPVQANKAIVGRNAFAHEAGIHQDGMLKDARTYEIMRPEDVGQSVSSRLVLGRHSGRHAVQSRCETLGFTLSHGEIDQVYRAVIVLGEHRKAIGDGDLRRIVDHVRTPSSSAATASSAHVEAVGYGHGV